MLPTVILQAFLVFAALCLGSLATALAYRLPRDMSMWGGQRSACPQCGTALGIIDLVPFLSWVFLRGRCRHCHAAIGWQYPLIELSTLLVSVFFYLIVGLRIELLVFLALAPVVVAMADIDFRFKIIPDGLNLSVFILGLCGVGITAILHDNPPDFILAAVPSYIGAAILYGFGCYALRAGAMAVLKKDPMGWGDIKFMAAIGGWIGFRIDALSDIMLAAGLSGIVLAVIWKRISGEEEFPFGPSLILGFMVVLFRHGAAWMLPI